MSKLKSFLDLTFPKEDYTFRKVIQSLWNGYGNIERWTNHNGRSIIVKHIEFPNQTKHPKGWDSNIGHSRKVKSYEVESLWYKNYSKTCIAKIPKLLISAQIGSSKVIVMEDLDYLGFDLRYSNVTESQLKSCISWLAQFHAQNLNNSGKGLWKIGTYWHLETRLEELKEMEFGPLKNYAGNINQKLNKAKFKTLVHGDSKLANFCFSENDEVAAVDFQYVGIGCGMKDLIYFLSSVEDFESKTTEDEILNFYFKNLAKFMGGRNMELENEWRGLYKYAWADFSRFLQGWSPGHWKLNNYVDQITTNTILEIQLFECLEIAKKAAKEAGDYIQEKVKDHYIIRSKGIKLSLASSIVTEIDLESQNMILRNINPLLNKFNFGLLSEELKDDSSRFQKEYFWCIDPLDGTLPFTEGQEGYSVSISLVSKNGEPILGVIYNPVSGDLYFAMKGCGGYKNEIPISLNYSKSCFTFITDRSFINSVDYESLLNKLRSVSKEKGLKNFEIITKGGASMNAIWVIENAPAAYIKPPKTNAGGGGLWDFSASACLFNELGLRATNYKGEKLDLNRKDSTFMNHEGIWFEA